MQREQSFRRHKFLPKMPRHFQPHTGKRSHTTQETKVVDNAKKDNELQMPWIFCMLHRRWFSVIGVCGLYTAVKSTSLEAKNEKMLSSLLMTTDCMCRNIIAINSLKILLRHRHSKTDDFVVLTKFDIFPRRSNWRKSKRKKTAIR